MVSGESMKCPKCGTRMKENYCMKCGYLKEKEKVYQIKTDVPDQSQLEKILGVEYNQFLRKKFNFSAFFFTYYYLLYYGFYWLGGILSFLHFVGLWFMIRWINRGCFDVILRFLEEYVLIFFPLFNLGAVLTFLLLISFLGRFSFGILFNPLMIYYAQKDPKHAQLHQHKSVLPVYICILVEFLVLMGIIYSYRYFGWFHHFI